MPAMTQSYPAVLFTAERHVFEGKVVHQLATVTPDVHVNDRSRRAEKAGAQRWKARHGSSIPLRRAKGMICMMLAAGKGRRLF